MKRSLFFVIAAFVLATAISMAGDRRSVIDRAVVTAETVVEDNSRFVSYDFNKTQFLGGEYVSVSITLANTGTRDWEASRVALWPYPFGTQNGWVANHGWSLGKSLVRPGETTTVTMNFLAPSTPQTTAFQWILVRDGDLSNAVSFGAVVPERPLVLTVVKKPSDTVNHIPTIRTVTWAPQPIVMQKPVQFSWTGSDADQERLEWQVDWNDGSSISKGGSTCLKPTECPSTHEQQFTASHTWKRSGPYTVVITVKDALGEIATSSVAIDVPNRVALENAEFVSGSFPKGKRFYAGSVVPLTIMVRNTGSTIWKASEKNIYLHPFPFENTDVVAWGAAKEIPITNDVGIGKTYTFTIGDLGSMLAPSQPDIYQLQWHLYRWTDPSDVATRIPFGPAVPSSPLEYTVVNAEGDSPVVDAVSFAGPSTVTVGETGTWTLKAVYPSNILTDRPSSYTVTFAWQDRQIDTSVVTVPVGGARSTQVTSVSHIYELAGKYDPQIYITNDQNVVMARASTGVVVSPGAQKHLDGSLLKSNNNPTVYRIETGNRRPFSTGYAFESRGYHWSDIVTVTPETLSGYPLGASIDNPPLSDGYLVKSSNHPEVYWTQNGQKRHIASEVVFIAHGFRWQDIHVISDQELAAYPAGTIMSR